jgi:YfiH family protein
MTSETGAVYYVSELLESAGVPHAFSTRVGGVSRGPFQSLNLGNPGGCEIQDERDCINENYRRLQNGVGLRGNRQRCWVHQVHGADVVIVRRGHEFTSGARADALVSDDPERILTIRVADCVPLLVASQDGRAVAAIHAGWRGVVAGVVPNALREFRRLSSDQPVLAAIGPCISQDSFEVGPEVLDQFIQLFGADDAPVQRNGDPNGKAHVDLRRAVQIQLIRAGLSAQQIDSCDRCTHRDADEFFSHRRDRGITGRMAAIISPRLMAVAPESQSDRE